MRSSEEQREGLREDLTFTAAFWGALLLLAWGYHAV